MSEIELPAEVIIIDMQCEKCNDGRMRLNKDEIGSYVIGKLPHKCDKCDFMSVYDKEYPCPIFRTKK